MTNAPPPVSYASPVMSDPDVEHLRLLAIFHWIVGGLQALFGLFPILHLVMGILMLTGNFPDSRSGHNAPDTRAFGWLFVGMAVIAMAFLWTIAALTLYSGLQIHRRRWRTFSIVIAAVNCLHFPFGTALGVFTLIVLLRRSVEDLYRQTAARN